MTPETLVGRSRERSWLDAALTRTVAGSPTVRIVAGEAGIGKTRLVRSVLEARANELLVLAGGCVEAGQHGLPYAPVTSLLRTLGRTELGATLLAELNQRSPGLLPLVDSGSGAVDTTTGLDQVRLFDALTRLLDELSRSRPTVLVVEDLHWADRSTLSFLSFLCRNLVAGRFALILTVRTEELRFGHPVRQALVEMANLPDVDRVDLEPFDAAVMGELLGRISGAALPLSTVREITDRSGGNPFLAEQLLAVSAEEAFAGRRGRSRLPAPLDDLLRRPLHSLSAEALRLVQAAALAGRPVEHELLMQVVGFDEGTGLTATRELLELRLLEVNDDSRYTFRHALLADKIAADLLAVERQQIHRRYAELLTGHTAPAVVTRHRLGAGDLAGAFRASHEAALDAHDKAARGDELAHWERVLELWPHADPEDRQAVGGLSRVARQAATAAAEAGAITSAIDLARRALATAETADERARARLVLAPLLTPLVSGSFDEVEVALAAVGDAEEVGDPELLTEARFVLARGYYQAGRFARAEELAAEVAEQATGAIAVGAATTAWLAHQSQLTRPQERNAPGQLKEQELVDAALGCGDAETSLWVLTHLADWWWPIDLLQAEERGALAYEYATSHGLRSSIRGIWARETLTLCRLLNGNWDAVEHLSRTDPLPHNDLTAATIALEAQVEIHRGRLEHGRRKLGLARTLSGDALGHGYVAMAELSLHLAEGDPAAAVAACVARLDRLPPDTGYDDIEASLVARAVGALAEAREHEAREHGAREHGAQEHGVDPHHAAELLRVADRIQQRAADRPRRHTSSPLTLLLAQRSRLDEPSVELWQAAVDHRAQRPHDQAACRIHLAEAMLAAGDTAGAVTQARLALDTADRLGAAALKERVLRLADSARLPVVEATQDPDPAALRWGLTGREVEVLALLAEGATNRAIGDKLFISAKTVSVHVSKILAKLDAANRGEAAAIARRNGLLRGD
ncbi:helix-turn-helix transcriptional regulator [Nocardioides limicola]|uniref:helix-turn-helix transcriptional regulator n=1 Tax=Nocardioides limicola TaxID=2803368 RepID=UPI00193BAD0B|nr:helix-turn-helix transcriptional regulator [Nocardioides sp. DJM-14]